MASDHWRSPGHTRLITLAQNQSRGDDAFQPAGTTSRNCRCRFCLGQVKEEDEPKSDPGRCDPGCVQTVHAIADQMIDRNTDSGRRPVVGLIGLDEIDRMVLIDGRSRGSRATGVVAAALGKD